MFHCCQIWIGDGTDLLYSLASYTNTWHDINAKPESGFLSIAHTSHFASNQAKCVIPHEAIDCGWRPLLDSKWIKFTTRKVTQHMSLPKKNTSKNAYFS